MKKRLFVLFCLVVLSVTTALADDIDIYGVSSVGNNLKPNVLIILDNSGSMATEDVPGDPYDSDVTYAGSYDSDAVYVYERRRVGWFRVWDWYEHISDIDSPSFTCELARESLKDSGYWSGVLASCTAGGEPAYRLGNYLNFLGSDSSAYLSRMKVAKEVVANLIYENNEQVNFGLMAFNTLPGNEDGGYLVSECGASSEDLIGSYTPGTDMEDSVQDQYGAVGKLYSATWTPLSETLGEAGLYFAGKQSWFNGTETGSGYPLGKYSQSCTDNNVGCQNYSGNSPIEWRCQKNYIIVVTDGEPTRDDDKFPANNYIYNQKLAEQLDGNTSYLDDVAEFLNRNDILPLSGSPTNAERLQRGDIGDFEDQNITTYTIGFKTDQALLQSTATRGGGKYYTANSAADLGESLTQIITAIGVNNEMYTATTIPVSSEDGVFAGNNIYLGLFQPTNQGNWVGNVKKYGFYDGAIRDSQGNQATNANGTFFDNAISYWSSVADGQDVTAGGAGEVLRDRNTERNIYTYAGTNVDLTHESNKFVADNTVLINDFGLSIETINAVRTGVKADWPMGSVLHFQPVVEHYDTNADGVNDQTIIFAGANDGMLHIFDDANGEELWAYIPPDLIQNLESLINPQGVAYFVDGSAVIYRYDHDDNDATPMKKIMLFGERRGGYTYTALDISTYNAPKFLYNIAPDILGDGDENLGQSWGAPQLAQIIDANGDVRDVFILPGGYDQNQDSENPAAADSVGRAVFAVDAQTGQLVENFKFSNVNFSDMTHSIISVSAFENPASRTVTRVYAGDMDGNLFAFRDDIFHRNRDVSQDSYNGQEDGNWEQNFKLHSIAGRKVWYPPNIVYEFFPVEFTYPADETSSGQEEVRTEYRAGDYVFFGTGDRSRPNQTEIENRFYAIKNNWQWDGDVPDIVEAYVDETDGGKIKARNNNEVIVDQQREEGSFFQKDASSSFIIDVTDDLIQNQEEDLEIRDLYSNYVKDALNHPANKGWFIRFVDEQGTLTGEKVVSSPQIYQGTVMFTTFEPESGASTEGSSEDPCSSPGSSGTGYFYAINYKTGGAVFNLYKDNDGTDESGKVTEVLAKPDRRFKLAKSGIPPAPTIAVKQGETTVLVGTQRLPIDFKAGIERMFWRQL